MPFPGTALFPSAGGLFPSSGSAPLGEYATFSATLLLCDSTGSEVAELEVDHTIRFEQSRAASITFDLGYDQTGASDLLDLLGSEIPLLHAYRKGGLIFRGHWQPQQETADGGNQDGITCEFRSPFARLETRYLTVTTNYSSEDQNQIAWNLVDNANRDSPTGLVQGVLQSGTARNRSYPPGQQVASAITDMADLTTNGLVFTETFLPPGNPNEIAAINLWSTLGRDLTQSAVFEYGEGTLDNVLSVDRTISFPVNRAIGTGGTALTTSVADDTASQALFGMYAVTQSFQNITAHQDHLDEATAALIQKYPVQQVTFEPDPFAASTPQPIDDYWLGDTILFRADQDELQVTATAQITAFEIDRDGAGNEIAHRIEFGVQDVRPLDVVLHGRRIVFRDPKRRSGSAQRHRHRHHKHRFGWHSPFNTRGPVVHHGGGAVRGGKW